jgi:hypothetical protein
LSDWGSAVGDDGAARGDSALRFGSNCPGGANDSRVTLIGSLAFKNIGVGHRWRSAKATLVAFALSHVAIVLARIVLRQRVPRRWMGQRRASSSGQASLPPSAAAVARCSRSPDWGQRAISRRRRPRRQPLCRGRHVHISMAVFTAIMGTRLPRSVMTAGIALPLIVMR